MDPVETARWGTTLVLGVAAIGLELRTKRIPNWLTLGALPPLFVVAARLDRLRDSAAGFLLAGCVGVWLFRRHALAGGGVKTAAMLGAAAGVVGGAFVAGTFFVLWAAGEIAMRARRAPVLMPTYPSTPIAFVAVLAGLATHAYLAARR